MRVKKENLSLSMLSEEMGNDFPASNQDSNYVEMGNAKQDLDKADTTPTLV